MAACASTYFPNHGMVKNQSGLTDEDMTEFETKFGAGTDEIKAFLEKSVKTVRATFCSHANHPFEPNESVYLYDGEVTGLDTVFCFDPQCFLSSLDPQSINPRPTRKRFVCSTCGKTETERRKMQKCVKSGHTVKKIGGDGGGEQKGRGGQAGRRGRGAGGGPDDMKHTDYARMIMADYNFLTYKDTDEVLYYKDGIYNLQGEVLIKEEAERRVEDCTTHDRQEIINTIRAMTYQDRSAFDADPLLLNVKNGIIDLETMELRDHTPLLLFRTQVGASYEPKAKGEKYRKFIKAVMENSRSRLLLHEIFASALLRNHINFEKAAMMIGEGSNGKSTLLRTMISVFGLQNVSSVSIHDLIYLRFARSSLDGKMLNIYADISSQELDRIGVIKSMISGDPIEVEKKNKPAYTIEPYAVMVFSANRLPEVNEDTDAIFRRFVILNFTRQFVGSDKDPMLLASLSTEEEKSGILNILLKHAKVLLKNKKLTYDPTMAEIRAEWRDKADPITQFITDFLHKEKNCMEEKSVVYSLYATFCETNHFVPMMQRSFTGSFKAKGFVDKMVRREGRTSRMWLDVKLKEGAAEKARSSKPGGDAGKGGGSGQEGGLGQDGGHAPDDGSGTDGGSDKDDGIPAGKYGDAEHYVCMECSAGPWANDGQKDTNEILARHMHKPCLLRPSDKRGNLIE